MSLPNDFNSKKGPVEFKRDHEEVQNWLWRSRYTPKFFAKKAGFDIEPCDFRGYGSIRYYDGAAFKIFYPSKASGLFQEFSTAYGLGCGVLGYVEGLIDKTKGWNFRYVQVSPEEEAVELFAIRLAYACFGRSLTFPDPISLHKKCGIPKVLSTYYYHRWGETFQFLESTL